MSQTPPVAFSTRDLYIASALVAAGCSLIGIDFDDKKRGFFQFSDIHKCADVVNAYHSDDLKVSAKKILDAHLSLKNRLRDSGGRL